MKKLFRARNFDFPFGHRTSIMAGYDFRLFGLGGSFELSRYGALSNFNFGPFWLCIDRFHVAVR